MLNVYVQGYDTVLIRTVLCPWPASHCALSQIKVLNAPYAHLQAQASHVGRAGGCRALAAAALLPRPRRWRPDGTSALIIKKVQHATGASSVN